MYERYFARGGSCPKPLFPCTPQEALRPAVCLDGSVVPGSIFGCVEWIAADLTTEGLVKHDSDELHMFVGGDPTHQEDLNGTVDFQIENDRLVFSETSFVFVPKGCAHNIRSVTGLKKSFSAAASCTIERLAIIRLRRKKSRFSEADAP